MRKLSLIFVSVVFALTSVSAWAQEDARQVQIQVVDAVNGALIERGGICVDDGREEEGEAKSCY